MLVMDNRRLMAELLRRVVAKTPRLNSRVSVLSSHFRSKKSIFRSMKSDRRNVLRCCLEILKKLKFSSIGLETNNLWNIESWDCHRHNNRRSLRAIHTHTPTSLKSDADWQEKIGKRSYEQKAKFERKT